MRIGCYPSCWREACEPAPEWACPRGAVSGANAPVAPQGAGRAGGSAAECGFEAGTPAYLPARSVLR